MTGAGGDGGGCDADVEAARRGDARALERLLREHHDRIHALCRRLLGNDDDALDATQEALISVARGIGRFDGRSAFSTWVYRVATNAALDELRRRRRRPEPVAPVGLDSGAPPLPLGTQPDPATAVAARIDVDAALATLPSDQRAAVVLRDLLALDYAEIAEVLSIPIGTVRSRIARGRLALALTLRAGGPAASGGNQRPHADRPNRVQDEP